MNSIVQVVKDVKAANRSELVALMVSIQEILAVGIRFRELMKRAPIAVKVYLDENDNNVGSLFSLHEEVHRMVKNMTDNQE